MCHTHWTVFVVFLPMCSPCGFSHVFPYALFWSFLFPVPIMFHLCQLCSLSIRSLYIAMGNTLSSNTTEALLNHASETGQWRSSVRNMSGNPTLYKAVLVRSSAFRIFSFSQPSTRSKKPIIKTTHRDLHAAEDTPSLTLLCSSELRKQG